MHRFLLFAAFAGLTAAPSFARDCTPVETAPGVTSLPRGCRAPAPAARQAVEASRTDGRHLRFGNTEIRVGGRISIEAGSGRSR
jgi:hypothetical protein